MRSVGQGPSQISDNDVVVAGEPPTGGRVSVDRCAPTSAASPAKLDVAKPDSRLTRSRFMLVLQVRHVISVR